MEATYVKRLEQANKVLAVATLDYLKGNDIDLKKIEMGVILKRYIQYSQSKSTLQIYPINQFVRDIVRLYPAKNHVTFTKTLEKLCLTLNNAYDVIKAEEMRKDMSKWIDPDDIDKHVNDQFNNRGNESLDDEGDDNGLDNDLKL